MKYKHTLKERETACTFQFDGRHTKYQTDQTSQSEQRNRRVKSRSTRVSFESDWLRRWRKFRWSIREHRKAKKYNPG